MSNLKEIRTRISSVRNTRQVTSAMKMVSAARLRKAQADIIRMRRYCDNYRKIIDALCPNLIYDGGSVYVTDRPAEKVLIVTVASNRGLCGAFNASVIKKGIELTTQKYERQLKAGLVDFYSIGKQGGKVLKTNKMNIAGSSDDIFDGLNADAATELARKFMGWFTEGRYDRIEIVYNMFKNAAVYITSDNQFLPVHVVEPEKTVWHDFIFEPERQQVIDRVIPGFLESSVYRMLLDSEAAEHGARMTAMHKATDNATELIKELTMSFNKARQAAITNQIIEVSTGAEVLNE